MENHAVVTLFTRLHSLAQMVMSSGVACENRLRSAVTTVLAGPLPSLGTAMHRTQRSEG